MSNRRVRMTVERSGQIRGGLSVSLGDGADGAGGWERERPPTRPPSAALRNIVPRHPLPWRWRRAPAQDGCAPGAAITLVMKGVVAASAMTPRAEPARKPLEQVHVRADSPMTPVASYVKARRSRRCRAPVSRASVTSGGRFARRAAPRRRGFPQAGSPGLAG